MTKKTKRSGAKGAKGSHTAKSATDQNQYFRNLAISHDEGGTGEQSHPVPENEVSNNFVESEPEGGKGSRKRITPPMPETAGISIKTITSWITAILAVLGLLAFVYKAGVVKNQIESSIQKLDEEQGNLKDGQTEADKDIKVLFSDTGKIRERLAAIDVKLETEKDNGAQIRLQVEKLEKHVLQIDKNPEKNP